MTDLELAYLAGLLDGEGTIASARRKRSERRSANQGGFYVLTVAIYNTHEQTVRWVHECFKGSLIETHRERMRSVWRWQIQQGRARDVLVLLRPFLRIKASQADCAVALWGLVDDYKTKVLRGTPNVGRILPVEELAQRDALVAQMSMLNRRGPIHN